MNHPSRKFAGTALVALLVASAAASAEQLWTEIEDDAYRVDTLNMTVGELDGVSLLGPDGQPIGELGRVLIEQGGDSIVVEIDLGEKEVLVPIYDIAASADGVAIEMTAEQLAALPEYEG